jgi:type IV pilus assembly protein PilE
MITVVIATILISVAVPAYTNQIRKSRRTEAKTAVLDLAARQERLFSTTNAYGSTPAALGYSGSAFPVNVGSGYYQINVCVPSSAPPCSAVASTVPTFQVVVTPVTGSGQDKDTQCASFTVDQTGRQSAAPDTAGTCWK